MANHSIPYNAVGTHLHRRSMQPGYSGYSNISQTATHTVTIPLPDMVNDEEAQGEDDAPSARRILRDNIYVQGGYALCIGSIYAAKMITEQAQKFFPLQSFQDNLAAMAIGSAAGLTVFGCAKLSAAFAYAAEQDKPTIVKNLFRMSTPWMLGGAFAVVACAYVPIYDDMMKQAQTLHQNQIGAPSLKMTH